MMKRIAFTGAVLLSSLLSINVMAAAPPTPEEKATIDIRTRQGVFLLLSLNNGVIGGMARGGKFDAAEAKLAAERIEMLAGLIPVVLKPDTRAFKNTKTAASDTIWDNQADIAKLAGDLAAGAKAAIDIIDKGGATAAADAIKTIGPKCGACHDRFRLK